MAKTMQINTTEVKQICSDFNSKVASIDLGSIDVAGAFEPFTSLGILTNYVTSLKEALSTITENCTTISSVLNNLATTQEDIDDAGKGGAGTDYFGGSGGSGGGSSGGSGGGGGGYSGGGTSVDNGGSTIGVDSGTGADTESSLSDIASSSALQTLLSILSTSPSTITSEERASYLKELLKLKLQDSNADLSKVIDSMDPSDLQAYLASIYNGELAINDATASVTYDILERIASTYNIEITNLLKADRMDSIRDKVEELSNEYIELFNSHNLQTELINIYEGTNISEKDEDFVSSVRTVVDLIALNNNTTGDSLLLEENNMGIVKKEIGKITESIGQLRIMSMQDDESFLEALNNIFKTSGISTS